MGITDEIGDLLISILITVVSMIIAVCLVVFTSKFIHEILIELGYVSDLYVITLIVFITAMVGGSVIYNN